MVRCSLMGAMMTRSSEELRAWRGDGGEVLVGEGDDGQVVGGDASWEWREWWGARWRGESGEVLVAEGDDDQVVGGDAILERWWC